MKIDACTFFLSAVRAPRNGNRAGATTISPLFLTKLTYFLGALLLSPNKRVSRDHRFHHPGDVDLGELVPHLIGYAQNMQCHWRQREQTEDDQALHRRAADFARYHGGVAQEPSTWWPRSS